jgi:peptidoglycan hydrolase CwlO-like protein
MWAMSASTEPPRSRPPWEWIGACALLAAIAIGFAIWAFTLQSDLDEQRERTAEAQQQAQRANKQLEDTSGELDQVKRAVEDAKKRIEEAGADVEGSVRGALDDLGNRISDLEELARGAIDELSP